MKFILAKRVPWILKQVQNDMLVAQLINKRKSPTNAGGKDKAGALGGQIVIARVRLTNK